jgi:ubiquinone/menaquinone biosynthesis C-methylase UbiE
MDTNILEYRKRILDKILITISLTGQEKVIDIGCGDGGDCDLLLGNFKEVIGIDIKLSSNWRKIKKAKIEFSVANVCNLPFPDESFELVFEKDVLHHVESKIDASKEILRITKSGGYIICVEANRYNPIFYFHMTLMKGHEHFSKAFFTELMKTYSSHVYFLAVESRVYPTKNRRLLNLVHYFEDILENMPLIRNYLCYNVAIVKKDKFASYLNCQ